MGTTSDKLTYLNDTKTKIRDGINAIGGSLNSDDTFRSYADELESLYNDMPKVTDTGDNITLENTRKGAMSITYKGDTQQDSTSISGGDEYDSPSPDHPQPIHNVSGDNTIVVEGKNKFNPTYQVESQYTASGASSSGYTLSDNVISISKDNGTYGRVMLNKLTLPSGTYTLSYIPNLSGSNKYVRYSVRDMVNLSDIVSAQNVQITDNTKTSDTFTLTSTTTISISLQPNASTGGTLTLSNIQLEKGNQSSTYTPYVSQTQLISLGDIELCKIGNYQDFIRKGTGKNLFDKDNVVNVDNKILNDSGVEVNDGGGGYTKMYIPVKPNTQYTISGLPTSGTKRIYYFDSSKTFISRTSGFSSTSTTITTPSNCYHLDIQYTTSGNNFNIYQVELGTTQTLFEPYNFKDKWYIGKEISKVVLDGSENEWILYSYSSTTNVSQVYTKISNLYGDNDTYSCLANYFKPGKWTGYWNRNSEVFAASSSGASKNQLWFTPIGYEDIEDWKTWLSTHNIEVYYVLATPTYTEITNNELLEQLETIKRSYDGVTNISQENNDLPFILDVSALKEWE